MGLWRAFPQLTSQRRRDSKHLSSDVRFHPYFVRFTSKSGHSVARAGLPLLTHRRHRRT